MSYHSRIAIVLASIARHVIPHVMHDVLAAVLGKYEFGFRARGGISKLVFQDGVYKWQERVPGACGSAMDLDVASIAVLVERYSSFGIAGSIRIPGKKTLYDFQTVCYSASESETSACIVCLVEGSLYYDVYGDNDVFNEEAAQTLVQLSINIGANNNIDGFNVTLVPSLHDIKPVNGAALREGLLRPTPIMEKATGAGLSALITGIRSSLVSLDELRVVWRDANLWETVNGFCIVSSLIDVRETEEHQRQE